MITTRPETILQTHTVYRYIQTGLSSQRQTKSSSNKNKFQLSSSEINLAGDDHFVFNNVLQPLLFKPRMSGPVSYRQQRIL